MGSSHSVVRFNDIVLDDIKLIIFRYAIFDLASIRVVCKHWHRLGNLLLSNIGKELTDTDRFEACLRFFIRCQINGLVESISFCFEDENTTNRTPFFFIKPNSMEDKSKDGYYGFTFKTDQLDVIKSVLKIDIEPNRYNFRDMIMLIKSVQCAASTRFISLSFYVQDNICLHQKHRCRMKDLLSSLEKARSDYYSLRESYSVFIYMYNPKKDSSFTCSVARTSKRGFMEDELIRKYLLSAGCQENCKCVPTGIQWMVSFFT